MGNLLFHRKSVITVDPTQPVNFDHFEVLRSIGKGSFGKVCIAEKRDTKVLYAIKYMNKPQCIKERAVSKIFSELDILRELDHPYIVNLRYAFHDVEDICLVVDLQMGGDLRYHITKGHKFSEHDLNIYLLELGCALDYLKARRIIHRDIKPDNVLLSQYGHLKLTDFNVAIQLEEGKLATNESGTHHYIAPEMYQTSLQVIEGYSYSVDWWSSGITLYELYHGKRPYRVPNTACSALMMFENSEVVYSKSLSQSMLNTFTALLNLNPDERIDSSDKIITSLQSDVTLQKIKTGQITPHLIPSMKRLNVDPSYELEEMIIESKPIHKKHTRLNKRSPAADQQTGSDLDMMSYIDKNFVPFDFTINSKTITPNSQQNTNSSIDRDQRKSPSPRLQSSSHDPT